MASDPTTVTLKHRRNPTRQVRLKKIQQPPPDLSSLSDSEPVDSASECHSPPTTTRSVLKVPPWTPLTRQKPRTANTRVQADPSETTPAPALSIIDRNSRLSLRHPTALHRFASVAELARVQDSLLAWYAIHQRSMPWRIPYATTPSDPPPTLTTTSQSDKATGPPPDLAIDMDRDLDLAQRAYEVWVSEIMLQQTQVVTVRGYYQRWMAEFPTITRLAAASLDRVYEIWTGLGYYSRARRLHEGAQKVVTHYDGGRLPADPAVLLEEVPGVGKYTAGAIASIAYGRPAPLVDGNVTRVLTRWFAFAGDVTRAPGVKWTWAAAEYVLQTTEPGHWNQALMELGATVCAPVSPKCNQCPIQSLCRAYKQLNDPVGFGKDVDILEAGLPDIEECQLCTSADSEEGGLELKLNMAHYPCKPQKKPPREEASTSPTKQLKADLLDALTHSISQVLISLSGITAATTHAGDPFPSHLAKPESAAYLGPVAHTFSHIRMVYHVYHQRIELTPSLFKQLRTTGQLLTPANRIKLDMSGKYNWAAEILNQAQDREYRWVDSTELATAALPTAVLKAFKWVLPNPKIDPLENGLKKTTRLGKRKPKD
ncbi:hypothetical protein H4R33_004843 [Dimargaris cristalligena]|nr:hypothetical protein H4R33_004843 [Dimargaris cristalligena]